jgi:predicted DNA-binding transcriptional regulator AlpA
MAHPAYLREKARSMRIARRLTIDELAERLALSRSTIYYWVRDLPIARSGSGGGWPESARRKGNRAMQRKYRLLRETAYRDGLESFEQLAVEPSFRDFVCMYIAEGYKRDRNSVAICNSDHAVLKLALAWIRRLTDKQPSFSIQYHCDQDLAELRAFWGGTLGIGSDVIRFQRKSNSGQLQGRQWRCRYGVLTVRVHDTYFRTRIEAWIDRLKSEWARESG